MKSKDLVFVMRFGSGEEAKAHKLAQQWMRKGYCTMVRRSNRGAAFFFDVFRTAVPS